MLRRGLVGLGLMLAVLGGTTIPAYAAAGDIVLYASDFTTINGNWQRVASASAAGGEKLQSTDLGAAAVAAALGAPGNYVEATFTAPAWTRYRVWLRLR